MAHTDFTFFLHVAPSHEIKWTVTSSSTASQRLIEVVHAKVWNHSAHLVQDPDELAVCHLGKAVANLGGSQDMGISGSGLTSVLQ